MVALTRPVALLYTLLGSMGFADEGQGGDEDKEKVEYCGPGKRLGRTVRP